MKKIFPWMAALFLATASAAQNVGIGTTNPQATLDISGGGASELVSAGTPIRKVIEQSEFMELVYGNLVHPCMSRTKVKRSQAARSGISGIPMI